MQELTKSQTAAKLHIENKPDRQAEQNLRQLVEAVLDPLREAYGKPIVVNSGYRSARLNKAVKGSKTSQHLTGEAADIESYNRSREENKKLFDLIVSLDLPFDQLINEYDYDWIHVSFGPRRRGQKLKAVVVNGQTRYYGI